MDYRRVDWGLSNAGGCRGYILFLPDRPIHSTSLVSYLSGVHPPWDHGGKYLVLGLKEEEIRELATTPVARKTEHLIGIVQVMWFILPFSPFSGESGAIEASISMLTSCFAVFFSITGVLSNCFFPLHEKRVVIIGGFSSLGDATEGSYGAGSYTIIQQNYETC